MPKIIASTKKNPWVDKWLVAGTSGHEYEVSRRADGITFGCKCQTWLYASAPKPDCQHILKKKLELMQEELQKAKSQPVIVEKKTNISVLPLKPGYTYSIPIHYGNLDDNDEYIDAIKNSPQMVDQGIMHTFNLTGREHLYNTLKYGVSIRYGNAGGNKIDAIKYVFQTMKPDGWGLVNSKKFVEMVHANLSLTSGTKQGNVTPVKSGNKAVEYEGRLFRGEDD